MVLMLGYTIWHCIGDVFDLVKHVDLSLVVKDPIFESQNLYEYRLSLSPDVIL